MSNPNGQQRFFDEEGAEAIRVGYQQSEITVREIAKAFGCSNSSILSLLRGETYKQAGGPTWPDLKLSDRSAVKFAVEDVNGILDSLGVDTDADIVE